MKNLLLTIGRMRKELWDSSFSTKYVDRAGRTRHLPIGQKFKIKTSKPGLEVVYIELQVKSRFRKKRFSESFYASSSEIGRKVNATKLSLVKEYNATRKDNN